jgi:hypothetical protein
MARGGSAGEPKAAGLSDSCRARKRMLNGFAVRRGAACLSLARVVFGAILGMGLPWSLSEKAAADADMFWRLVLTRSGPPGTKMIHYLLSLIVARAGRKAMTY